MINGADQVTSHTPEETDEQLDLKLEPNRINGSAPIYLMLAIVCAGRD